MGIIVKNILIEAYHFMKMVKCYHKSLRQVDSIITTKIPAIKFNSALQMFFKVINNSVSPNGLVSTLLVFDVYFRIIKLDKPSLSITQRAMALKKAIK